MTVSTGLWIIVNLSFFWEFPISFFYSSKKAFIPFR